MNDWFDKIRNCQCEADVLFTKDGDYMVVLWYCAAGRPKQLRIFRGIDCDVLLYQALGFAETFDAYCNTAAICSTKH